MLDLPTRLVKCLTCNADVIINAHYPIDAVQNCKNCGLYGKPVVNRANLDKK